MPTYWGQQFPDPPEPVTPAPSITSEPPTASLPGAVAAELFTPTYTQGRVYDEQPETD